ncbi:alkaline phosphatase [Vibrio sp. CAU 1672]|nr:alkaline phosphatase [Vibrio sp. CAU 1672]MDF2153386.1 alkaline phosphatase [Vibrio sp. CAU 1672]
MREDRNLTEEFQAKGYRYLNEFSQLSTLDALPAIGLFANKALPFALDDNPTRLVSMTEKALLSAVNQVINRQSYTGWTTGGHTGHDVQVFAYGRGFEAFRGAQENTDIALHLINYIQ